MVLANELDLDEECEGEDCPPCEGKDCPPCEGEDCPPCKGEDCPPCEGEYCPVICEDGSCIGSDSFTAYIERIGDTRSCVKGDFSGLDEACDVSQIFVFVLIGDGKYGIKNSDEDCIDNGNGLVLDCDFDNDEFKMTIEGTDKITSNLNVDLKVNGGQFGFLSGDRDLFINIQEIISAD